MSGFAGLPPEVTSALLYSGPGVSSLVAAASAWNGVAAELTSTAQGYDAVVTQLTSEEWLGPASTAVAQAVQPYVNWLTTTAAQAEQAGSGAAASAAAFETAFASVVPPPLIAANRAELAEALQLNIFGQYNNLIEQLESQYADFWAQNTAALQSYASQSAAATNLQTFTDAPTTTNAATTSAQSAATSAATSSPVSSIQSALQNFFGNIKSALSSLSTPSGTSSLITQLSNGSPITEAWFLMTGQTILPANIGTFVNGLSPFTGIFYNTEGLPYFSVGMGNFGVQIAKSSGMLSGAGPAAAALPKPPISAALGASSPAAAGLGHGAHIGRLAVPASWPGASAAPAARPAVEMISEPVTAPATHGAGNVLGGMPIAGTGAGRGAAAGPRYGFKPTVVARPLSAG